MENIWALLLIIEKDSLPYHTEVSQANGQPSTLLENILWMTLSNGSRVSFYAWDSVEQVLFPKPASRNFQPKTCNAIASKMELA